MRRRAGPLRVRNVDVVGGVAPSRTRIVWCPKEFRSRPLDECVACEHSEGLITDADDDRDLVLCWARIDVRDPLAESARDGASTPVAAVLRRDVVCVAPETSIDAVAELLASRAISAVPVVGQDRKPIGVVSRTDLLVERAPETAADVMTARPLTVAEGESVSAAAAIMAYEGVHRLVVVDPDGKVVGVVSSLDVLRWMARHDGFRIPDYTQQQR